VYSSSFLDLDLGHYSRETSSTVVRRKVWSRVVVPTYALAAAAEQSQSQAQQLSQQHSSKEPVVATVQTSSVVPAKGTSTAGVVAVNVSTTSTSETSVNNVTISNTADLSQDGDGNNNSTACSSYGSDSQLSGMMRSRGNTVASADSGSVGSEMTSSSKVVPLYRGNNSPGTSFPGAVGASFPNTSGSSIAAPSVIDDIESERMTDLGQVVK
jgi:hypothetical protein